MFSRAIESKAIETLAVRVIILAFGLCTSIILTRYLGPSGRGELATILLWPAVFVYLTCSGFIESIVYFGAQREGESREILWFTSFTALSLSLVITFLAYLSLPAILSEKMTDYVGISRYYLITMPMLITTEFNSALLLSRMHFRAVNLLLVLTPVGYLVGVIGLVWGDRLDVRSLVMLLIVLSAVRFVGGFALLRRHRLLVKPRRDLALCGAMLRYAGTAHAGSAFHISNGYLDQALIASWLDPKSYGLYVTAASTARLPLVLSQAVVTLISPRLAQPGQAQERAAQLATVFRRYWLGSGAAMLLFLVVMTPGIPFLYGSAFDGSVHVAQVLLLGTLVLGAKDVLAAGVRALGKPRASSKAELVGILLTLPLLLVTLPMLGIMGAAITSVISYGASLAIIQIYIMRTYGVRAIALFLPVRDKGNESEASSRPFPNNREGTA